MRYEKLTALCVERDGGWVQQGRASAPNPTCIGLPCTDSCARAPCACWSAWLALYVRTNGGGVRSCRKQGILSGVYAEVSFGVVCGIGKGQASSGQGGPGEAQQFPTPDTQREVMSSSRY